MKCRRREVFEFCRVEHILMAEPQKNSTFMGIPDWVHGAFRDGALVVDQPEASDAFLLVKVSVPGRSGYEVLRDGYVIRGEDGKIDALPGDRFKQVYEIID